MADDIPQGQPQLSITQEIHRLVAEGRKGREAAKYSDDQKGSGFRWNDASMIGQFSKESHQRTAHHIDRQGAEGKLDTLTQLLGIPAHEIAQDGSDEPSAADEKNRAHGVTR